MIQRIRLAEAEPRLAIQRTRLVGEERRRAIRQIPETDSFRLVFLISSAVLRNSRALRQLATLTSQGVGCTVVSIGDASAGANGSLGFRVKSVDLPAGRGPSYFWSIHRALASAASEFERSRPSVVHASDLYSLPAARILARRTGAPLTYDAREVYPHVAATAGRPWISGFWRVVEAHLVRSCDAVFTVNESIAAHIAAQYGVPRPTVVENVPPFRSVDQSHLLHSLLGISGDAPIILHQGHIKRDRGCEVLVRAASSVPDAYFVFLGDGPLRPDLQALATSLGLQNRVRFLDPVPPDRLLEYSASATVGVTLLEDTCLNHRLALPNKLFEYLMARTPVLATDLPEIRRIVAGFGVGRLAIPGSSTDTAKHLREMISAPSELASYAANTSKVFETINWEKASERFLNVFADLLNRNL